MSLSESLFENLIKQTEERAINIKYLCPKTGLEKLGKQNVFKKYVKNSKSPKNDSKEVVDLTTDVESDPLDPLATSDLIIPDDYLSFGGAQKKRAKKTKANQKLFENSLKISAPNLSTDELENIVFSAKNQKNFDSKKSHKTKHIQSHKNLTVPPLKIKLGKIKSEVISVNNTNRNIHKKKAAPPKKSTTPRASELDRLLGDNAIEKKVQTPTKSANKSFSVNSTGKSRNLPSRIRTSKSENYLSIDISDNESNYSQKFQNNRNIKNSKKLGAGMSKLSNSLKNLKNYKSALNQKFGRPLKIKVKRLSLKTISQMTKPMKKLLQNNKLKNKLNSKSPTKSLKSKSASFTKGSRSSRFSISMATSSPKLVSSQRASRSLNTPINQKRKRTGAGVPPPNQNRVNSKLFFKFNTIPSPIKRRKISTSPSPKSSVKIIRKSGQQQNIIRKSPQKNIIRKSPQQQNKRNKVSPKPVRSRPAKPKNPPEIKIDPTHFEKPYLTEKFGKQYLKCHVKIGKIKSLDGNVTVSDWEAFEEKKIQKHKEQRRSILNKSVSFLETVEIFGESETEGSEGEDENVGSEGKKNETVFNELADKKDDREHNEEPITNHTIDKENDSNERNDTRENTENIESIEKCQNTENINIENSENIENNENCRNNENSEKNDNTDKIQNIDQNPEKIESDDQSKEINLNLEAKQNSPVLSEIKENLNEQIEKDDDQSSRKGDLISDLDKVAEENDKEVETIKENENEDETNKESHTVDENESSGESSKEHTRKIRKKRYYSPLKSDDNPRNKSLRVADEKIIRPSITTLYGYEIIKSDKQKKREEAKQKREQQRQEMKEKKEKEKLEKLEQRRKAREEAKLLKKKQKEEGEEDEEYLVEKIEDRRKRNGTVEYYIKWAGYPREENTWEPQENITDKDLIMEFEANFQDGEQSTNMDSTNDDTHDILNSPTKVAESKDKIINTEDSDNTSNQILNDSTATTEENGEISNSQNVDNWNNDILNHSTEAVEVNEKMSSREKVDTTEAAKAKEKMSSKEKVDTEHHDIFDTLVKISDTNVKTSNNEEMEKVLDDEEKQRSEIQSRDKPQKENNNETDVHIEDLEKGKHTLENENVTNNKDEEFNENENDEKDSEFNENDEKSTECGEKFNENDEKNTESDEHDTEEKEKELNESEDNKSESEEDSSQIDEKVRESKGVKSHESMEEITEAIGIKSHEEMVDEAEENEDDEEIEGIRNYEEIDEEILENINEKHKFDKNMTDPEEENINDNENYKNVPNLNEKSNMQSGDTDESNINENKDLSNTSDDDNLDEVDLESLSSDHSNDFEDTFDEHYDSIVARKAIEAAIAATTKEDNCDDDDNENKKEIENPVKSETKSSVMPSSTTTSSSSSALSSTLSRSVSAESNDKNNKSKPQRNLLGGFTSFLSTFKK